MNYDARFIGEWWKKGSGNVEEWGRQDVPTLLLAMQEELGELTQAHLESEAEDGDSERIEDELADLGALCFQLQWVLSSSTVSTEADSSGGDPGQ